MIRYYSKTGTQKLYETASIAKGCWIYLENPSHDEMSEISEKTNIPVNFINSALDEEERARIENENDYYLTLIDIPKETETDGQYIIETIPMAIIFNDNYFITVCTKQTSILDDFINNKVGGFDTSKQRKLLYQVLYNNFTRFLFYLKKIDRMSGEIQKSISKSMENKELLQLVELQKSLVFFSASLSADHSVVQKIMNYSASKNTPEERELLDDVLIEVRQAIEMCSIYREIIKNSMDAFSSITSNNMNLIMKLLTALTIVMSIPMIISGLWGMNTGVPWEGQQYGFWIATGIAAVLSVITLAYFIRKRML